MRSIFRLAALALLASTLPLAAQQKPQPLLLGTAWYPEQWPESRWETDLTLMQQAGMHVVRVAEFAWSTLEPTEGHFDFTWLDHAIALAAKHNIVVVLGTPSAAPPAWLTTKYPDTLRVNEDGRREEHGGRVQFSSTSPRYRELSARIAREMARRYGHNPNVVGWQIDNEIGAPTFDPTAITQWHRWLEHKYKKIADLNRRWATAYWSQTYDTFGQVPFHSKGENPALLLDYKHFVTDTWTSYVENQVDVIRPLADARQLITTNSMHWYPVYDHYQLHKHLDLAAWDDYFPDGHLDPILNAASHDLVRGYKQRNFWLMETQPAFVNWGPVNSALPPGVTREMAWQAVGHGADAVLYWQWRSAPNGQEQYHGSLLGADGLPVPVYAEVAQVGKEFALAGAALTGTSPHSDVAILNSYDSRWAIDFQKHTNKFDYVTQILDLYRALQPTTGNLDLLSPDADLTPYKAVFAAAMNVISEPAAQHLLAYVQQGGHLILGPRSGMKDADNALDPHRQPGPLAAALGAHVDQFYALDKPAAITGPGGISGSATIWAETLTPTAPDTQVLLTYAAATGGQKSWLDGQPAAVSHAYGKGTITYIGATLDPALLRTVTTQIIGAIGVHPLLANLPEGIEQMQRSAPGKAPISILINHSSKPQHITLQSPMHDLLHDSQASTFNLAPHDVLLLEFR